MDFQNKEPTTHLLYADLFKSTHHKKNKNKNCSNIMMMTDSFTTSSTNPSSSSFYDSSSSDFSSPFGSDLDSSESDDGDYMAELTRQMAECMLQEEENDQEIIATTPNSVISSLPNKINTSSAAVNNGLHPTRKLVVVDHPRTTPHLQVYNLKNGEPPFIKKQISDQPKNKNYMHNRSTTTRYGNNNNGSGLQAVFLGQPGSRNASNGTGVFLPRVTTQSTTPKKKSGCSTVLIPTRVLQTLELHFNRRLDSGALNYPSNFNKDESLIQRRTRESQSQNRATRHEEVDHEEEMQLPKEWTY